MIVHLLPVTIKHSWLEEAVECQLHVYRMGRHEVGKHIHTCTLALSPCRPIPAEKLGNWPVD